MSEFDFAPALRIEERIDAAEADAITERWEFGKWMLSHVPEGGKKLPTGFLARLSEQTGKSQTELRYRRLFAEKISAEGLVNAIDESRSWYSVVNDVLPEKPPAAPEADLIAGPLPEGQFRTIVADPPWDYGNKATRGSTRKHYATMSIEDICALDVGSQAAADSHLYLWVTNGFIREGFDVLEAWGFTYKTCITWAKTQIGLGNYFRGATEHVLFGVKGGLRTNDRNIRNWFEAPRGKHSAKPDCFFDLVERASDGPYLELFSRRGRIGWEAWGNEALETVEVGNAA